MVGKLPCWENGTEKPPIWPTSNRLQQPLGGRLQLRLRSVALVEPSKESAPCLARAWLRYRAHALAEGEEGTATMAGNRAPERQSLLRGDGPPSYQEVSRRCTRCGNTQNLALYDGCLVCGSCDALIVTEPAGPGAAYRRCVSCRKPWRFPSSSWASNCPYCHEWSVWNLPAGFVARMCASCGALIKVRADLANGWKCPSCSHSNITKAAIQSQEATPRRPPESAAVRVERDKCSEYAYNGWMTVLFLLMSPMFALVGLGYYFYVGLFCRCGEPREKDDWLLRFAGLVAVAGAVLCALALSEQYLSHRHFGLVFCAMMLPFLAPIPNLFVLKHRAYAYGLYIGSVVLLAADLILDPHPHRLRRYNRLPPYRQYAIGLYAAFSIVWICVGILETRLSRSRSRSRATVPRQS